MGEVVEFPRTEVLEPEIDLLSAVDFAIRDLRDIARSASESSVRRQAAECGLMLGQAFHAALREYGIDPA